MHHLENLTAEEVESASATSLMNLLTSATAAMENVGFGSEEYRAMMKNQRLAKNAILARMQQNSTAPHQ